VFANSAFSALPLSTLSGSLFGSSVAEAAAGNDNTSMGFAISLIVAEGLSASEQVGTLALLTAFAGENSSLIDALFSTGSYAHTVIDQASVSQLRYLGGGFSAGSMSSGPYSGLGDDLTVVSGDLFFAQTTVNSATIDSASALDSAFTTAQMSDFLVVEAASGIDNSIGNIEFNRSFSDAAIQSDSVLGNPAFSSTVVDAASIAEEVSSILTYNLLFIEAASTADLISATYTVNSTVDETALMQDEALTKLVGIATVITSASYTDFVTSRVIFQTNVVDSVQTLDQFSARLQWEPIPTGSSTDWILINVFS